MRLLGWLILGVAVVLGSRFVRMSQSLKSSQNALVRPAQQPHKTVMFRRVG